MPKGTPGAHPYLFRFFRHDAPPGQVAGIVGEIFGVTGTELVCHPGSRRVVVEGGGGMNILLCPIEISPLEPELGAGRVVHGDRRELFDDAGDFILRPSEVAQRFPEFHSVEETDHIQPLSEQAAPQFRMGIFGAAKLIQALCPQGGVIGERIRYRIRGVELLDHLKSGLVVFFAEVDRRQ